MKKVVVLIMLMMSSWTLSAQWSVTPEAGMTAVRRGTPRPYINWGSSYDDWRAGWKIGAAVEYDFSNSFALKSGLYYTQRGYSYSALGIHGYNPTSSETSNELFYSMRKNNRHFLEVPVMAKFSWKLADGMRFNLAAGPYVGVCIGENTEWGYFTSGGSHPPAEEPVAGHYVTGNINYGYGSAYYNSGGGYFNYGSEVGGSRIFDWGGIISAGVELNNWTANFSYGVSLGKEYEYEDIRVRYHTLGLTVGYKFKLAK